jgi:hypothetical protein
MLNKLSLLLLAALPLVACQTTETVVSKPVQLTIIQPVDPQPVDLLNVHVNVVTKGNVNDFIAKAAKDQGTDNPVFVVLGTKDYQALSLNIAELKRYIEQEQKIIAYYKKATATTDPAAASK